MTPSFNLNSNSSASSYFTHQSSSGPNGVMSPSATLSAASGRAHQRNSSSNGPPVSATGATGATGAVAGVAGQRNIVGVLLPNGGGPDPDSAPQESMFLCLQDLFQRIQNHSKKTQFFTPTAFVAKVKKENGKEFWLINGIFHRGCRVCPIRTQSSNKQTNKRNGLCVFTHIQPIGRLVWIATICMLKMSCMPLILCLTLIFTPLFNTL